MTQNAECPNCRTLQSQLKALQRKLDEAQARIATLEAELRRGRRQAAPFSRDEPQPDPKPPGRRPGQGEFTHRERCAAVHVDETGWRIGVLSAWLWVFTSRQITVYSIAESRSHEVVVEILGREFAGVLVSDCFTAYDHQELERWLKQRCFAHFLHELSQLEREKSRGAVRFPRALLAVLREALHLKEEKPHLSETDFRTRRRVLEERLDALIATERQFRDPDNARLAARLRRQRKHLFTFLEVDEVEATNNRAERALRPAVIVRKTGGCNRQRTGAKTHAILASLLVTAKQQGGDPLEALVRLLTGQSKLPWERSPPVVAAT